jgi:hypothetical protein
MITAQHSVPELPLCLSTGPRWPGGASSSCQFFFTMDFCLCGAILYLKAFCLGAIPDIMTELIVYGSVPTRSTSFRAKVRGLIT